MLSILSCPNNVNFHVLAFILFHVTFISCSFLSLLPAGWKLFCILRLEAFSPSICYLLHLLRLTHYSLTVMVWGGQLRYLFLLALFSANCYICQCSHDFFSVPVVSSQSVLPLTHSFIFNTDTLGDNFLIDIRHSLTKSVRTFHGCFSSSLISVLYPNCSLLSGLHASPSPRWSAPSCRKYLLITGLKFIHHYTISVCFESENQCKWV